MQLLCKHTSWKGARRLVVVVVADQTTATTSGLVVELQSRSLVESTFFVSNNWPVHRIVRS